MVKVISRDIDKLYGTFIKNKNIKKKKLKDWKVVAFYYFQQYATHLNVLIIPKKIKIKMKVDNLMEYSHYEGELKKLCFL